jgi:broad specificity phosphatase PhoE
VYLVRHGETDWNQDKRIQGRTDIPLNGRGKRQAEALAERLADLSLAAIYTSDLKRARETAEMIAARQPQAMSVSALPDLRECHYGLWEGLTREEVARRFPEDWQGWLAGGESGCPTGGEDFRSLRDRAGRAFAQAAETGKTVLISTHRGPLRSILCHALGLDHALLDRFFVGNCSLSALECGPGHEQAHPCRLILLNDTCHLHGLD